MVKTPPSPLKALYAFELQTIMDFGKKNLAKILPFFPKLFFVWGRKKNVSLFSYIYTSYT